MLDDALKETIQAAYRRWLAARGFAPRRSQREMIATIARHFSADDSAERRLAIEAGTGTGKTVAYLLGALPIARASGFRLVISTATVALQEQLVDRDLPDLAASSGLGFSFVLAKGRGRYLCPRRLQSALDRFGGGAHSLELFGVAAGDGSATDGQVVQALADAFFGGRWDGDRDSLLQGIADAAWQPLTTDHRGCGGRACPLFRGCPYFEARARVQDAEVVVANHDLVLADLALGGGVVLPEAGKTMYVFDEAHHLVDKAQQHFALEWRAGGGASWIDGLEPLLATMQQRLHRPAALQAPIDAVIAALPEAIALARAFEDALRAIPLQLGSDGKRQFRFPLGVLPNEVAIAAATLAEALAELEAPLAAVHEWVGSEEGRDAAGSEGNEAMLGALGAALRRLERGNAALGDAARADHPAIDDDQPPHARWLAIEGVEPRVDLVLRSVPVAVDSLLDAHLWQRAHAVLLTSATLAALGDFGHLFQRIGLPPATTGLLLPSPFDYPRQGTLEIPAMRTDGGARDAHTQEIAELLPELLRRERATLVLFTSWRQLRSVLAALPVRTERFVLCQGDLGRAELLARHRQAVDAGKRSAIFGLASFAEGIDLPGEYCTHVIVCKLPFPVPDDPLFAGTCEWLEQQGTDPFDGLSVPEAALRMVQACGRLIRSEHDRGLITVLDRRLVTRRYGRRILDSLPPFARVIASAG